MPSPASRERILIGATTPSVHLEWPGGPPPGPVTVTVYDPRYGEALSPNPLVTGAATQGTNTTTSAAAAAGQKSIPVTVRTGIAVDDALWLQNAAGQKERIEVAAIAAGIGVTGTLTARHDLDYTYASGALVVSPRLTYAMPPSLDAYWAAATNLYAGYSVKWTAVGFAHRSYFDLVRQRFAVEYALDDFLALFPDALRFQPADEEGLQYARQIAVAQQIVESEAATYGWTPDKLRGAEDTYRLLVSYKLGELLALNGVCQPGRNPKDAAEWYERNYVTMRERYLGSVLITAGYDRDQDGAPDGSEYGVINVLRARRY